LSCAIASGCLSAGSQAYGREWTIEELALGLMKDVGDLAMLVQASQGVRQVLDLEPGGAMGRSRWIAIQTAAFPIQTLDEGGCGTWKPRTRHLSRAGR
jgi:hypothetical protein